MQTDNPIAYAALVNRVERLERQNRRFRAAGLAGLGALVLAVLMGQSKPATQPAEKTIRAERFVVVDAEGKTCAVFGHERWRESDLIGEYEQACGLFIRNPHEGIVNAVSVALVKDIPRLELFGLAPEGRSSCQVVLSDEPTFQMGGKGGMVGLDNPKTVGPQLWMTSFQGQKKTTRTNLNELLLGYIDQDNFGLRLSRNIELPKSEEREKYYKALGRRGALELRVSRDGRAGLHLFDEKGNTRTAIGSTVLIQPKTGVEENRPPSSIVLFDTEGKVMWQVPP